MSLGGFILRNALRNKRRSFLTTASVAVSLFLFVTLQVAIREMTIPPEDVSASLRIAVRNKISLANPLPARQLSIISRMPGVAAVMPFTFFGGNSRMTTASALRNSRWIRKSFCNFSARRRFLPATQSVEEHSGTGASLGRTPRNVTV